MNIPPSEKEAGSIETRLELLKKSLAAPGRIPISTYRLQLNKEFSFKDAEAVIPYLKALGITHCYTSPYLAANPGSMHGYDICDYNRINPELGGDQGHDHFVKTLKESRMGHILDFVPNHMGITCCENHWWQDVLENGRCSPYGEFFDIDWNPVKGELKGKVLLPILGAQYGVVLEQGELNLEMKEGALFLRYYDQLLPINPQSTPLVYELHLESLQSRLPEDDPHLLEFLSILTALKNLPVINQQDPEQIEQRNREKEVARQRMMRLLAESDPIRRHVEQNLKTFAGEPGDPESFNLLHKLLEQQAYRLAYWKTAAHEINYRRFFDINHLAALRMERGDVFEMVHTLILQMIASGKISGLRLDHVDGLLDPAGYFEQLQEGILYELARLDPVLKTEDPQVLRAALRNWRQREIARDPRGPVQLPQYLVAEKVLTGTEYLPEHWSVHGTSGYDFLNEVNSVFIDGRNEKMFSKIYSRYTGSSDDFLDIVYRSKKVILQTSLSSELNVLALSLNRISEEDRHFRDFTLNSLREALREVIACFPIYRTYMDSSGYNPEDRETLEKSIARARRQNPAMEPTIFDFIRQTLLPQSEDDPGSERDPAGFNFIMKFQQFTGPVQAKGLEDTAFYRYHRLISLNEVGGHPQRFGITVAAFHQRNIKRQKLWPATMTTTATHDHKRGEDARARINVLSEIPDEWRKAVRRWSLLNRNKRSILEEGPAPDRNDEYLFYQTLVGTWPAGPLEAINTQDLIERLTLYMQKAIREAKVHASWLNPNNPYEDGVMNFIRRVLTPSKTNRFPESFVSFHERIARAGVINSLSQVLLKITSPGVPDFYQGTELWDLSLVDPDNRKPVDFEYRNTLLDKMESLLGSVSGLNPADRSQHLNDLLDRWEDGRIKLFVTAAGLRYRRDQADLFLHGDYVPLQVTGERADHIIAFARYYRSKWCITIAPCLVTSLMEPDWDWPVGKEVWKDTAVILPSLSGEEIRLRNMFTQSPVSAAGHKEGAVLDVSTLFSSWPLALLASE